MRQKLVHVGFLVKSTSIVSFGALGLIRNSLQKWKINWPRICINMNKNPFLNNMN